MRYIVIGVLAVVAVAVLGLFVTRPFSMLVDRFHTVLVESQTPDHFVYDNAAFELGTAKLYTMTPEYREVVSAALSASGRASVLSGGQSFPFGTGRAVPQPSGLPYFEFSPDQGDTVRLTAEHSLISWPTPFATNFMTGVVPSKKRNFYRRLVWTKRSGAQIEMLWREEQGYFPRVNGWGADKVEVITAGLVRTRIREAADLNRAAAEYLQRNKHWNPAEYRLEDRGPSSDGREEVIFALHRDDVSSASPGAGRSVELHLSFDSRKVTRELGGQ